MGNRESAYRVFVQGKPEGKRKIGRRKRRWKNTNSHFQEIKWQGLNWVYLSNDRDKCREFLDQLSEWLSGRVLLRGVSYDVYIPVHTQLTLQHTTALPLDVRLFRSVYAVLICLLYCTSYHSLRQKYCHNSHTSYSAGPSLITEKLNMKLKQSPLKRQHTLTTTSATKKHAIRN